MHSRNHMNIFTHLALRLMAAQFNFRPSLNKHLKSADGWTNFSIGLKTETGTMEQAIVFQNGHARVLKYIPEKADAVMRFINDDILKETVRITPNEMLNLILKNKIILDGNMAYLGAFNFYISLIMGRRYQRMLDKANLLEIKSRKEEYGINDPGFAKELDKRKESRLKADTIDAGVKCLEDPYLSEYSIEAFPRIKMRHEKHFNATPEISSERPVLLTQWYRRHGFEKDSDGNPWTPELRQAYAFKYLMKNKKPVIRKDSIIAGTTCPEEVGVLVYPDTSGTLIWGELGSISKRVLTPCNISKETAGQLHDIFPFWAKRTTRAWISENHGYPFCQKIDERSVASFNFKTVSMSHTVPDLPRFVNDGTLAIIEEVQQQIKALAPEESDKRNTLTSMMLCLEGLNAYAANLAKEAKTLADKETDPQRKEELNRLYQTCSHVPANPARTLDEAVNAAWISWIGLLMENTNVSLSPGRLDQLFQPFFEKEMGSLSTGDEKKQYLEHVIELISCYFLRNAEHHNLVPDVANYLFGGSQSETAITVGGVTPDGKDAVNDMTYIILKVTEMLSLNDPNMNARFKLGVNSDTYLKRLCEVNYVTVATPSMHNDDAVMEAFSQNSDKIEDLRDWASTGCVEITLSGKHMSHTGATSVNMVAGLEMALNNGYHPLMNWHLGPKTGVVANGDFKTFDDFFVAFAAQQKFIIDNTVELNNMAAEAYAYLRPTPLLSTCIKGAVQNATDVTKGGAVYNTSGSFNIGLSDVVDSLMVIKKLVFDEKRITFEALKDAIDSNFENDPSLHAMVHKKVPRFGSGSAEAVDMANKLTGLIHGCYKSTKNFRGGDYTVGFWSVAQHVAYGTLSGALPSGRLAGRPFAPGATPDPSASKNFLDNIRDVAQLNPHHMDNNIAFNVKLVPGPDDSREKIVNTMFSYVKTYFEQGGMQIQFNVIHSDVLKDAMANPENYQNLLVRISGYNAYFVRLNKEMQIELIERAKYGL
ncbi:MAG: formate acetyltransferase [Desulfobacterium sp.]|nr:formate acetyltransferase [Desulfobacterium sp.]